MNAMNVRSTLSVLAVCWLLSACGAQPTPPAVSNQAVLLATVPARTTTPADAPAPRIISFTVLPDPVERGQDMIVSWQVDGASKATLWQLTYDSKMGRWHRQPDPISSGSNSGEYRLTVPGDANRTLRFELEVKNAEGDSVTVTSDEIRLACHPLFFKAPSPAWCPNAPESTAAAFQAFEGGYMIWRADTGQVYVLRQATSNLPPDWFAFFPTEEAGGRQILPGESAPGEHFQRAWANLPEHWHSLGVAISPEQTYTLTMQLSLSRGDMLSHNEDLYLTWPTGEIAHLRVYLGAPNHASGPAWSFLGSDQSSAVTEAPSVGNPAPATHTVELISEPASITLPAGASGRVVMKMNQCDQQSATFAAPTLPLGVSAEFLTSPTPCEQTVVLHTNVSLSPGEYAIAVTRQSSTARIATGQLTLQVGACIESQAGEFTTAIQSNLISMISAGKPSIEHGLLVPLQICSDRQLVIDLLSATSEAGTAMTTPPRFYLYRSWVWPAPDAIQANAAQPWTLNVAVPRIDSNGWQLMASVPAGMYLLVFERDAYGSSNDPMDIPAAVTYRLTESTR
jgi:hypothetical protein